MELLDRMAEAGAAAWSLILVAPAVFHYVGYFVGFGAGQPQRIFSGG